MQPRVVFCALDGRREPRVMLLLVLVFTLCRTTTCYLPAPWREPPRSAYVHIPFCRRRCHYCDFNVYAVPVIPQEAYTDAIVKELETDNEQ